MIEIRFQYVHHAIPHQVQLLLGHSQHFVIDGFLTILNILQLTCDEQIINKFLLEKKSSVVKYYCRKEHGRRDLGAICEHNWSNV